MTKTNGQSSKNAVQKAKKIALRNASQSQNGRGDKVTPRRSVISTPCALQASSQIFGRDMRTWVVAEQQPSRTWVPNYKSKKRGDASLFAFMVKVTRFELAASTSRTVKALYNKGFRVIFSAFVSEIGAFQGYPTHCVHTVQVRRWSKVWSEQIFTRTRAPNRESSSSFFLPIV